MDRWDHASLLPAGTSPAKALEERSYEPSEPDSSEPGSPLADGWGLLDAHTFRSQLKPAVKHSGWLLKACGTGPQRQWRRRYVYVLADRLCYTPDPGAGEASPVRYLPMDRIPVRALPRGYGPKLGVTLVEDRQVGRIAAEQRAWCTQACSHGVVPLHDPTKIPLTQVDRSSPDFSPKKVGCVFSVACGSHTHFFAARSPAEAKVGISCRQCHLPAVPCLSQAAS